MEPGGPPAGQRRLPHGTTVHDALIGRGPVRVQEFDRFGSALAVLRWSADRLESAWLRLPDRSWLALRARATTQAPWGLSDALSVVAEPGEHGQWLSLFEAVDYAGVDRIPTLADPASLPAGAGTAVLNLLASLAADQGRRLLAYRGPYPTEQLFLSLLESFRFEPGPADPLAAFMAGELAWRPVPHERLLTPEGAYLQVRGRVEKVVWRGRTYYRPDWQRLARHAPRRIVDTARGPVCCLWALGRVVQEHLLLRDDGTTRALETPAVDTPARRPMAEGVIEGVAAVIAATGAPPLRPFVPAALREVGLVWADAGQDLVDLAARPARVAWRLRSLAAEGAAAAPDRQARTGLGLAILTELAMLVADAVRARAQAHLLALSPEAQAAALEAPPPADPAAARIIAEAVAALLDDLGHGAVGRP